MLFLKHGCLGLILIYSIFQATILFLVNNAGCFYCPFSKRIANMRVLMVFLCLPSKKQLIYELLLSLISVISHLSMVSFLINSNLQRFFRFLKRDPSLFSNCRPISSLPCLSKVFEKLFYLRLSRFLQSLISLITISMALDHITLLLRLS